MDNTKAPKLSRSGAFIDISHANILDESNQNVNENENYSHVSLEDLFVAVAQENINKSTLPLVSKLFDFALANGHINHDGEVIIL